MTHRHRSRVVRAAWLLGALAVAAAAAGVVLGGPMLVAGAVVAAAAAVATGALAVRTESAGRTALAVQRGELDVELDRRLAVVRDGHDAGVALLQARIQRADRDRQQLELALQMAMIRRTPAREGRSGLHGVDLDQSGRDVAQVRLDRAS
jgi:hypothetical protein